MKNLLFLLVFLMLSAPLFSQQSTYKRVKIDLKDHSLTELVRTGIEINAIDKTQTFVTAEITDSEIQKLESAGFHTEVLIADMQQYYVQRNLKKASYNQNDAPATNGQWAVPQHFKLGPCGGFLTVDQMLLELDSMRLLYPNLISVKTQASATTTIEGRKIYYVKISDNPNTDESEPELLYTGMHHAREPIGMQHLLYYMWYLLENYDTDQEIRGLVNSTEMYFVPVVNVDGYQYNISTAPGGGGMWRKNRRNNGDGSVGIDLNRNYGYAWGYDDDGSSPYPYDETYRGTEAFSEPETQIMKEFCEAHNFKIALNYHSYSNLLLYAWGFQNDLPPDNSIFYTYAQQMSTYNTYLFGPGYSTIYPSNGGSDDWMYGEQVTKNKILAYTPEVGSQVDGFWPEVDRIIPLCKENMLQSLTAARLVGVYAKAIDRSPLYVKNKSGAFQFELKRYGQVNGSYTISLQPLGNSFLSVGAPKTYSAMALLSKQRDSISYQLTDAVNVGDTLRYLLTVNNGSYDLYDTITKFFGYSDTLFFDKFTDMTNWTANNWNTTTSDYRSSPRSMADSPSGVYPNNAVSNLTMKNTVHIAPGLIQTLHFYAKWVIEREFDYVQVKISEDNGQTWTPLQGTRTHAGGIDQDYGQPLYDGSQFDWLAEVFDLKPWEGKDVKFRITLKSDGNEQRDGFYLDDFMINVVADPTATPKPDQATHFLSQPYPNPAEEKVTVKYVVNSNPGCYVSLNSIAGTELMRKDTNGNTGEVTFDLKKLAAGVYILKLANNSTVLQSRKLLIR